MARRRRRWIVLAVLLIAVAATAAFVLARVPLSSERLRQRVIKVLSERLDSTVELAALELRFSPRLSVVGSGLIVRHRRHVEVPLITVRQFEVSSALSAILKKHITQVTLDGLVIQIPPGDKGNSGTDEQPSRLSDLPRPAATTSINQVVIDELIADDAVLQVLSRLPDRPPKTWTMHELHLHSVGLGEPMPFRSILTNAVPPGEIVTAGTFGPWNVESPGGTPIAGTFTFDQADLGVFKGIDGTLSSRGEFKGTLERLDVDGRTSVPDFTVSIGAHPVPLDATYHAVVDATSGDTALTHIAATFLNTSLTAQGGVFRKPGVKGRQISLDIAMEKARLEDILQLVVNAPRPPMTGGLVLTTHFELPPGDRDVVEKLGLRGSFRIVSGRFTDRDVQTRINSLSGRAQGKPGDDTVRVTSNFAGTFALGDGTLALRPLHFDVPGALVQLAGTYGLRDGSLALGGDVVMDAKLSQAMGGWKAWLLKPIDPLFRRDGRTFIPVTITGSRGSPKFGFDRRRLFNRDAPPTPAARQTDPATARPASH